MKDKLLLLIVLLAFILRIVGLTPNFLQHPDEPGVIEPANKILINTIINHNPDPNVEPLPFKYASTIFYMHALIRGIFLSTIYITYKTTGYTFSQPATKFTSIDFEKFIKEIGPDIFSEQLLWIHRLPSVLFGTATVLLVYCVVLVLLKKRSIALLSALSLAVMPHHVRDSHWATVNIIQAFFFLVAFYCSAKILQKPNTKNYIFAGISTGFAISIKYFPLPILPLIFFLFLAHKKTTPHYLLITLISILTGYWIGMPYIFIYFQKITDFYFFSVDKYAYIYSIGNSGQNQINSLNPLIGHIFPPYIHGFHLQFLLKSGVGIIMSAVGIAGVLFGLKRWIKVTFSLLIIPVANLVFVSFYLAEIYETLLIPILPFFAVFVGIGSWLIFNYLNKKAANIFIAIISLIFIFLPTFSDSLSASLACTKTITEFEAHDWIAANVPEGTILAYQPNMRLPSKNFTFVRSEPKENFLLAEVQSSGAKYIALHSGYTDRYTQWIDDNIFLPQHIKNNDFTNLVLQEYAKNAKLLKSFVRPIMCVNSRIYIYEIPQILESAQNTVVSFEFNNQNDLSGWKLDKPSITSGVKTELNKTEEGNTLFYQYKPNNFSPTLKGLIPYYYGVPLRSPFISIKKGKKYTVTILAKRETKSSSGIPDGLLRLDFYEDKNKEPISTRFSPRLNLEGNKWEKLVITTYAPTNTYYATIGFQTFVATEQADYLIRQAQLLTE